jgi:predicted nuclease of predicted toxin-antitoxin system
VLLIFPEYLSGYSHGRHLAENQTGLNQHCIKNNHLIFTHDRDFGTLLAAAKTNCLSVLQIRTQDISPEKQIKNVIAALTQLSLTTLIFPRLLCHFEGACD